MGKRIVSVTIERHYTKQATIEVEVDDSIVGEELQEFLTHDEKIDDLLENALAEDSLSADDTIYEYQDPTNGDGGHL
jgi:ribosome assembly protein YihI (activator of Der GTPase)